MLLLRCDLTIFAVEQTAEVSSRLSIQHLKNTFIKNTLEIPEGAHGLKMLIFFFRF